MLLWNFYILYCKWTSDFGIVIQLISSRILTVTSHRLKNIKMKLITFKRMYCHSLPSLPFICMRNVSSTPPDVSEYQNLINNITKWSVPTILIMLTLLQVSTFHFYIHKFDYDRLYHSYINSRQMIGQLTCINFTITISVSNVCTQHIRTGWESLINHDR